MPPALVRISKILSPLLEGVDDVAEAVILVERVVITTEDVGATGRVDVTAGAGVVMLDNCTGEVEVGRLKGKVGVGVWVLVNDVVA